MKKWMILLALVGAFGLVACDDGTPATTPSQNKVDVDDATDKIKEGAQDAADAVKEGADDAKDAAEDAADDLKDAVDGN